MGRFRDLMARLGLARPPEPLPYGWTRAGMDEARALAGLRLDRDRERGVVGPFRSPEEKWAAAESYLPGAMAELLAAEAAHELVRVVEQGGRRDGRVLVPFADLDRVERFEYLAHVVDWTGYVNRGLDPETADRLIFGAATGKPPEHWLRETPAEATERAASHAEAEHRMQESARRIRDTFDDHLAALGRRTGDPDHSPDREIGD